MYALMTSLWNETFNRYAMPMDLRISSMMISLWLFSEEHHLIPAAIAKMVRPQLLQIKDKQTFVMLFPLWDVHHLESSTLMKIFIISVLVDNTEQINSKLDALLLNRTNDTAFVDAYNAVIGTLNVVSAVMCVNSCETCMNGSCGIFELSDEYVESELGNYTYDEIVTGSEKYVESNYTFLGCIDYTTNGYGKVCFSVEYYAGATVNDESCYFKSNGVQCNSCVETDDCFIADCTNIESTAMINTCNGTGFIGPFAFFQYIFDNSAMVTNSTFTVGSCDPAPVPTSGSPGHYIGLKGVIMGRIIIAMFTMTMMI
jgi:ribosomal protein L30/L7E